MLCFDETMKVTPQLVSTSKPNIATDSGQLHEHIRVLDSEVGYSCASRACVLDALRHAPRSFCEYGLRTQRTKVTNRDYSIQDFV